MKAKNYLGKNYLQHMHVTEFEAFTFMHRINGSASHKQTPSGPENVSLKDYVLIGR